MGNSENRGLSYNADFTNSNRYLWAAAEPKFVSPIYYGDIRTARDRFCSFYGAKHSPHFVPVPQFSLYPHKTNTTDSTVVNLFQVIERMRSPVLKSLCDQIREARQAGDVESKDRLKSRLPYITHTGIFIPRRNEGLRLPGFTYQLDIDKIENADDILRMVISDSELTVLFASKSVSGNGVKAMLFLKGLMFIKESWTHEEYKDAYRQAHNILERYFIDVYSVKIDGQMKAISQPFYLFYSPNLFVNKAFKQWVK
jgi:VirE N-terminal domain